MKENLLDCNALLGLLLLAVLHGSDGLKSQPQLLWNALNLCRINEIQPGRLQQGAKNIVNDNLYLLELSVARLLQIAYSKGILAIQKVLRHRAKVFFRHEPDASELVDAVDLVLVD